MAVASIPVATGNPVPGTASAPGAHHPPAG
jgi:hypothetical protein